MVNITQYIYLRLLRDKESVRESFEIDGKRIFVFRTTWVIADLKAGKMRLGSVEEYNYLMAYAAEQNMYKDLETTLFKLLKEK